MSTLPRKSNVTATSGTPTIAVPTVGDSPFVPMSDEWRRNFASILDKAILGGNNPLWNDAEELQLMRSVSFVQGLANIPPNVNDRFSKLHPVSTLNIPRDPTAVIQMSARYSYENPFVAKALRVKTDFTVKNFHHRTHKTEAKNFYDEESIRLHLWERLREIVWSLCSVGMAPVYWGGEEGNGRIQFIEILDPRTVHVERIFGKYTLYLKIDDKMKEAVLDPQGLKDPRNKSRYQNMPAYWIKQIKQNLESHNLEGLIQLKDGSYAVVENRYSPHGRVANTLDGVPLQPAFDALQKYRLLSAGDFAVAWGIKNMITLISEGDPKAEGESYIPPDTARLAKLQQMFQRPDYAFTVFCDPTTKVEFVIPPVEAFAIDKYIQPEKEIKEVLGLPGFMWLSDKTANFSGATAELRLLREEVDALRMLLQEQFFRPLYTRLRAAAARPGFSAKDIVLPSYDQNSLRDDAIWLSQNNDLYGRGAISLRSLCDVYGLDFDYEIEELSKEHEKYGSSITPVNDTVARPLYEPSQGGQLPLDKPGRPQKGPKESNDPVRTPRSTGK